MDIHAPEFKPAALSADATEYVPWAHRTVEAPLMACEARDFVPGGLEKLSSLSLYKGMGGMFAAVEGLDIVSTHEFLIADESYLGEETYMAEEWAHWVSPDECVVDECDAAAMWGAMGPENVWYPDDCHNLVAEQGVLVNVAHVLEEVPARTKSDRTFENGLESGAKIDLDILFPNLCWQALEWNVQPFLPLPPDTAASVPMAISSTWDHSRASTVATVRSDGSGDGDYDFGNSSMSETLAQSSQPRTQFEPCESLNDTVGFAERVAAMALEPDLQDDDSASSCPATTISTDAGEANTANRSDSPRSRVDSWPHSSVSASLPPDYPPPPPPPSSSDAVPSQTYRKASLRTPPPVESPPPPPASASGYFSMSTPPPPSVPPPPPPRPSQ